MAYTLSGFLHQISTRNQKHLTSALPDDKSSQPRQTSSSSHNRGHMLGKTETFSTQFDSPPSFSKLLLVLPQSPSTLQERDKILHQRMKLLHQISSINNHIEIMSTGWILTLKLKRNNKRAQPT